MNRFHQAAFLQVFALLFLSSASLAYDVDDALVRRLYAGSQDDVDIVRSPAGDVLSIIGRFPSLESSDADEAFIAEAVGLFTKGLGINARIQITDVRRPVGGFVVADFDQCVDTLRVLDSQVTVGFHSNGDIQSFNGGIAPPSAVESLHATEHTAAIDALVLNGVLTEARYDEWVPISRNLWSSLGATLERFQRMVRPHTQ